MTDCRTEKDFLGALDVPRDAYWGIHTERARAQFPHQFAYRPSGAHPGAGRVKQPAAWPMPRRGGLPSEKAAPSAGRPEIAAGGLFDQFPLDALQGGAGTSTNMNLNEVIANRAIELLGGAKGDYAIVSPLDDVNRHQSTNDVYPTALQDRRHPASAQSRRRGGRAAGRPAGKRKGIRPHR
jgi:aspartate ammonia-lyase